METIFESLNGQLQNLCVSFYQHKDSNLEAQWKNLNQQSQLIKERIKVKREISSETLTALSELVNLVFDLENKIFLELCRGNVQTAEPKFLFGLDPLRSHAEAWPPLTHTAVLRALESVEASIVDLAFYFGIHKEHLEVLTPSFFILKFKLSNIRMGLKIEDLLYLNCRGNVYQFQKNVEKFQKAVEAKNT